MARLTAQARAVRRSPSRSLSSPLLSRSSRSLAFSSRRSRSFSACCHVVRGASAPSSRSLAHPLTLSSSPLRISSSVAQPAPSSSTANGQEIQASLLTLPDEVLGVIFEIAYANATPEHHYDDWPEVFSHETVVHKPLSRRLWPIQQRVRCWCIDISSYSRLAKLSHVLVHGGDSKNAPSGPLIVHVAVRVSERDPVWNSDYYCSWDMNDDGEAVVPDIAAGLLAQLFSKLGQLKSLTVDIASAPDTSTPLTRALLAVIVEDPSTPANLHGLKSLNLAARGKALHSDDATEADDFGAWLHQFSRFANLEELHIVHFSRYPSTLALDRLQPRPVLEKLSKLSIYADFRRWDLSLKALAPSLTSLSLSTGRGSASPIIRDAPPTLLDLGLDIQSIGAAPEIIDDLLPSFPLLQSLVLERACYDPDRLPSTVGQLEHLEHLDIGLRDAIDDELVRRLIRVLPSLRRLQVGRGDSDRGPALLAERHPGRERDLQ